MKILWQTQRYNNDVNRFVNEFNANANEFLREEARLFLKTVIKFTPPKSHSQGRAAIKADLFGGRRISAARYASVGIFQRIGSSRLVALKNKMARVSETVAVSLGWEASKTIRIFRRLWRPNATNAEMAAHHKKYQNPNTGRTVFISQSQIGRWKVADQMWVSDATANRYFNLLSDRVGWAKAGWKISCARLGITLPRWISRNGARGGYIEELNASTLLRKSITLKNAACKIPNYQRVVDAALRARAVSLAAELKALSDGRKSRRQSLANRSIE